MALNIVLKETETFMKKSLESTQREFAELRSGRANPRMVEGIRVNYYGTPTLLKDISTISIPEARLIIINPWDPTSLKSIEKAILQSDLGITPIVDGKIVRLVVPPFSEERRNELIKLVKKIAEEGKVSVRTIRREAKEKIRELGGNVSSSVSKNTDYVVVGKNPGSKYEKAKKLKVKIIKENKFLKMIK